MSTQHQNTPALIAYQAITSGEKTYWRRIGAAWTNKKDGFQVKLDALPVNGELVLLPPSDQQDRGDAPSA